ncbi:hypothetical protein BJ165DRAFT_674347 [Panaeolus papilionaceus]|nr:hypothetical protein BJ165DRAFT_674347 [Panaeolus papilionaceus]
MRMSASMTRAMTLVMIWAVLALQASANFFVVQEPNKQTQWVNNAANVITWRKSLLDGINGFDLEMARMGTDGLTLIAKNVPVKPANLNIQLSDVPPGDDYYLIFINSTHGIMHTTSEKFTILAPGATPSSPSTVKLASNAPTVTVQGGPNPTAFFATTFPAISGATLGKVEWGRSGVVGVTMGLGMIGGGLWTVGW